MLIVGQVQSTLDEIEHFFYDYNRPEAVKQNNSATRWT